MTMNLGMYNNTGGIYSGEYAMGYSVGGTDDTHGSQYHGYEDHSSTGDNFRSGGSPGRSYNAGFYSVEGYQEYQDLCQRECQKIPHEEGFYHLGHSHQAESFNIITSNGLSYTDLDYGSPSYQKSEPSFERLQYPQKLQEEVHHHQQELHHHHHHHHHEDAYSAYHQLSSALPDTGQHFHHQETAHFQSIKEEGISHSLQSSSMSLHNHRPSPQQAVPTYKWMQVKRNVPKPQGTRHNFYFLL